MTISALIFDPNAQTHWERERYIDRTYMGYTLREAKGLFRKFVKENGYRLVSDLYIAN